VLCGLLDGLDVLRSAGVEGTGRVQLIGGGSRSAAYRQRAADLLGRPITVPDADEAVATGAALQAAMTLTGRSPEDLAKAWQLGSGVSVEPVTDASDVRGAYRAAQTAAVGG
jgi:xylulokinase